MVDPTLNTLALSPRGASSKLELNISSNLLAKSEKALLHRVNVDPQGLV